MIHSISIVFDVPLWFSAITCPTLPAIANGEFPTCSDGNNLGSSCEFSCSVGFGLSSTLSTLCFGDGTSATGEWTSAPPTCTGKWYTDVCECSAFMKTWTYAGCFITELF